MINRRESRSPMRLAVAGLALLIAVVGGDRRPNPYAAPYKPQEYKQEHASPYAPQPSYHQYQEEPSYQEYQPSPYASRPQTYQPEPYQPKPQYQQPEYPKQEYPRQEYPKQEYPKQEYPKQEYPKQEYPKQEYPKQEYPKQEYPKQEYPKQEYPKQEYPKPSYKQPEYPQPQGYQQPEYPQPQGYQQQPYEQPKPTYNPYQQPSHYDSSYGSAYPSEAYPSHQDRYPQPQHYQPSAYQPSPAGYGRQGLTAEKPAVAAVCDFGRGAGSGKVQGKLTLTQGEGYDAPVKISGSISPLSPGKHGFHVHMYGDFSDGCTSAGGHYNPLKAKHGSPDNDKNSRHAGDLGNIDAGPDGVAHIDIVDPLISLADGGKHPVGGRAIVVHEKTDDLGRGGNDDSLKTGNAGGRLGCCVITYVDPSKL